MIWGRWLLHCMHTFVCETSRQSCDVCTHYQYTVVYNILLGSACLDKQRTLGQLVAIIFVWLVVSQEKLRNGLLVGTSGLI